MKLTIELVPRTAWFSNLRKELTKEWWDRLRRDTYQAAGYECEICGGKGPKWPVECHEKWAYNDQEKIQTLLGLIALCPSCHQVKHIGLANVHGKLEQATTHLIRINNIPCAQAVEYIQQAVQRWQHRSMFEWTLDVSWLEREYGIKLEARSP